MAFVITGASGFVGAHLQRALASLGEVVVPLPRGGDVIEALTGARVVVHLAARVHVMNDKATDPLAEFREANVHATELLARQAAQLGVKRFVFMSSVKVNGEETFPGAMFTEQNDPAPADSYGVSKSEAEIVLRRIAEETGLEVVIIRAPLIYGPGVKANFASLIQAIKQRLPLPLGSIRNKRSLIGIDNLVDFVICCSKHPAAANQTFLVSDDHDVSTPQLIRELALAQSIEARLFSVPIFILNFCATVIGKKAAVKRLCGSLQVDISKARTMLGWRPPVSLSDGLKKASSEV